jgi:hypothetical protein
MSVWFCIPSARPIEEAKVSLVKWRQRGYKIALWRDKWDQATEQYCDMLLTGPYPGYAMAVNAVVLDVLKWDEGCNWVVLGGDDMEPDPNYAPEEIAAQCEARFGARIGTVTSLTTGEVQKQEWPAIKGGPRSTFGVMQPTGDRWGQEPNGSAYCDRVAGSAWIGRKFAETVNGGCGPLWHEYFHMGVDEELQGVATRLGVFWQRPDLAHLHRHWARTGKQAPAFLARANSPEEWAKYKQIFRSRQAAGFPGHQPVEVIV